MQRNARTGGGDYEVHVNGAEDAVVCNSCLSRYIYVFMYVDLLVYMYEYHRYTPCARIILVASYIYVYVGIYLGLCSYGCA